MKINPQIFRSYDIRGINNEDLNPKIVEQIGKGFGTFLREKGTAKVIVGRDTRLTSEEYQKYLTEGLLASGCDVYDQGLSLASAIYFSRHNYKIDGAVMVTSSHNPPNYNGFKLCQGVNAIVEEEIQHLKQIILGGKFKEGKGKLRKLPRANREYYQAIIKRVKLKRKLKVLVDCGHATPALFLPSFLKNLGCEVATIHNRIDPSFPAGVPDPVNLEYCQAAIAAVRENKADIGVILDADGDRAGFIDEQGRLWLGDMILDLLIRDFLPKNLGAKVIVELKDSEIVVEDCQRLGGIPIFWKTGHALLDHKVFQEKALLCGEMSCHYWITKDWYVFDDSIFALAHVLRIVSQSAKPLGLLMNEIPQYPSTPEYRIACPEEKKAQIVNRAVKYFKQKCQKAILIDGIRGYLYNGWFLLRKSNTQPLITVRCEAKTKRDLEKIKTFVKKHLDNYQPDVNLDWARPYDIKKMKPFFEKVLKPWGYEIIFTPAESSVTGKILHLKQGARFSYQYHDQKEETLCLLKGKAKIILNDQEQEMTPLKGYFIKSMTKHRCQALTDCDILEASTPEKGNTVRLQDDYCRQTETEAMRSLPNRGWTKNEKDCSTSK
jgi:phosphomannomutase/phosphoglucomutase